MTELLVFVLALALGWTARGWWGKPSTYIKGFDDGIGWEKADAQRRPKEEK